MRWWSMLSRKAQQRVITRGDRPNDVCMCGDYLEGHMDQDPPHIVTDVGSYMDSQPPTPAEYGASVGVLGPFKETFDD